MLTILAGDSPTAATRGRASPALAFAGVTISFLGLIPRAFSRGGRRLGSRAGGLVTADPPARGPFRLRRPGQEQGTPSWTRRGSGRQRCRHHESRRSCAPFGRRFSVTPPIRSCSSSRHQLLSPISLSARNGKVASPRVKTGMRSIGASTVTVPPPVRESPVQTSVHFVPAGR
jgi:hypothetical protein